MNVNRTRRRALIAPTVRHSSTRSAASAALHCVLAGYGLPTAEVEHLASPPHAAESSHETLETLAEQFGLRAHCRLIPVEYLSALPSAVLPGVVWAAPHEHEPERLLVLWQRIGPWVQVMDTALGLRWLHQASLTQQVARESIQITSQEWRNAVVSSAFTTYWQRQLLSYGFESRQVAAFIDQAQADSDWYTAAALDAVIRMVGQLIDGGALQRGAEACTALERLYAQTLTDGSAQQRNIPDMYWSLVPATDDGPTEEQRFWFRGTWMVEFAAPPADTAPSTRDPSVTPGTAPRATTGTQTIISFLRLERALHLSILGAAVVFASGAVVLQALLLRSAMTLGEFFSSAYQQSAFMGALLLFVLALLWMEWHINSTVARIGRRLDMRLRIAVLERLRMISMHELQHRSTADQMERIHASRDLHNLPEFVVRVLRTTLLLVFTLLGIAWIDPLSGVLGLLIVGVTIGPFWLARPLLDTLNLDARTHLGHLMRFYLDGMLGLVPIQVHSAERMMRQVYERYLTNWIGSMLELAKAEFWVAALEHLLSHVLIATTVLLFVARDGSMVELPLLLFWLFQLALSGRDLARQVFRTLNEQSKCTRFTDLLEEYRRADPRPDAATTEADAETPTQNDETAYAAAGAALAFSGVSVQSGDATILHPFDLSIAAGSHVAIVGPSGAGKSTLVGLLAGQHRASTGTMMLDAQPLTPARLATLRQHIAWVDPLVQIWNRSLLYNLAYGGERLPLARLLDQADLRLSMAALPNGMQTLLGERGRRVSGGQGQRVRLGRAMQRPDARLVILDEPFRGLDQQQRAALLTRARAYWHSTTLLCITHDVSHTTDFERVLVVDDGRIIEDDSPSNLVACPDSRYRALLDAEQVMREQLWAGQDIPWRPLRLEHGTLQELPPAGHERATSAAADAADTAAAQAAAHRPRQTEEVPVPTIEEDATHPLTWHSVDVDAAVRALAYASGLNIRQPAPQPARQDFPRTQRLEQQIEAAAGRLNLDVETLEVPHSELAYIIQAGGPALIQLSDERLLLLSSSTPWRTTLLAPDLRRRRVRWQRVQDLINQSLAVPLLPEVEHTLASLSLPPQNYANAQRVLLQAQLAHQTVSGIWLLRLPASAPLWQHIRHAGLRRYLIMALGGELMTSLLYVAAFGLLLLAIATQHVAWGWLTAALLLVLLRVPAEMARWLGEQFIAVGLRDIIKRRLFHGVLHLDPDRVKQHGTGQFLGWVMESERLEQAAQAVPFLLSTLVSLSISAILLALGAGGVLHSLVLFLWLLLLLVIGRGSLRAYLEQRTYHHQMTRDLLERMEGHQTRLVQEDTQHWHDEEDQELAHYHMLSLHDDHYRTLMAVVLPYGWLIVSLLTLLPAFLLRPDAWVQLGSSFLGILWVFQLLRGSLTDVFDLIRAIGARQLLKPIEEAAARSDQPLSTDPCPPNLMSPDAEGHALLEMQQVRFAYPDQESPTLTNCTVQIYPGNRLLLVGPSGGGKSTLAALLAGQRAPQGGMVLLHGLDRQTTGAACWRRHVVIAPQFHENHIIDAPLLFNLLLGRTWPPLPEDVAAADALCRELGLAPLIERMPGGLYEPVGETGWQLSHGERSRVYIARTLLQGAGMIILDESFGSLDPHSMQASLRCALNHADTLLVVAHP